MAKANNMARKKYIVGSFDDEAVLFPAVKKVRKAGYKIHEVFTPFPIHGLDKAMGLRDTSLHTAGFIYAITGTASSIIANRVSYFYDFRGPSVAVDTACSSSLVAAHQGVQALRSGEADVAIVGGVNALITPLVTVGFDEVGGVLAPDGLIKSFSKDADGYAQMVASRKFVDRPPGVAQAAYNDPEELNRRVDIHVVSAGACSAPVPASTPAPDGALPSSPTAASPPAQEAATMPGSPASPASMPTSWPSASRPRCSLTRRYFSPSPAGSSCWS